MNILSLFDGMSCGRIALDRAGITVGSYYASEIDKYAKIVSQANYPDIIQFGDATKWRDWDIDWQSIDLLIGGSPCQGFSFAGKQLAFDDPRSKLFFVYVDVLDHIRSVNPDVKFLLENVKMKQSSFDVISEYLGVEPVFINSALVSAQNRQRLYWANWEFAQPEDLGIVLADIVEDGFTDIDKPFCIDECYHKGGNPEQHFNKSRGKLIFNKPVQTNPSKKAGGKQPYMQDRCFHRYGKSHAITAAFGSRTNVDITENMDGTDYRKLTPIECERLQTIDDNYTNHVSNAQRYRMLGNGWTVDVIAHIFRALNHANINP